MLPAVQLSLFGAEAAAPRIEDLSGVLIGGGQWRRGGRAAGAGQAEGRTRVNRADGGGEAVRLSVLVDATWRQEALLAEFAARGIAAEPFAASMLRDEAGAPRLGVRTGFDSALAPLARRWRRGASIAPPPDLVLEAAAVRLWAICAGRREDAGYMLRTRDQDGPAHRIVGAQLARLGIVAESVGVRGRGGWRVSGARRERRLA